MMASRRNRSLRTIRGARNNEDCYKLDPNRNDAENLAEIVRNLTTCQSHIPDQYLCLLNCTVKILKKAHDIAYHKPQIPGFVHGVSTKEFFYVITPILCHQMTQVRAASIRVMRHVMRDVSDLKTFNDLQLPDMLCRSLDIMLSNDEERVQALKLIRKMLVINPKLVSASVVRCLVSLGEGGSDNGDRMLRSFLAVLCEFGVLHPKLMIYCGGVGAITRNVLECHSPRIAESLCGVLLHLLERPETRNIAAVRLDCLAAPYCDFTYRAGIMEKNKDARDLRFTCSRLALLSVLRSWAGVIEFCDPEKASGLKAIVDVLYLNQLEVRKATLDLLYELLGLPQPVWTDEISVALSIIDPADFQDSWRLSDGFVAMEGRSILPTLAKSVPNVYEIHTSLLLYCFLETGLMDALVEVIVTSDTFISVRATVLLGKIIHLIHRLLPAEIASTSSALPRLVAYATQNNHQATAAIAALQNLHQIMKNRPASCSLYLDCVVQSGSVVSSKMFKREIYSKTSCLPLRFSQNNHSTGIRLLHRIDSSKLLHLDEGQSFSGATFSFKALYKKSGQRQRHNSSGSNSADMTFNETQPNASVVNTSTVSAGSNGTKGVSLKRSGSMKLNKFLQFLDPSQSASFFNNVSLNFLIDDKEMVQLNTDKEIVDRLIKESEVLANKEASSWDWDIIALVFRTNLLFFLQKMDDNQVKFLRRIILYFKPSSNRFSHQDLSLGRQIAVNVLAGLELIDWYLRHSLVLQFLLDSHPNQSLNLTTAHLNMVVNQFNNDCVRYLSDLIGDINHHLEAITTARTAHDCLFSPQHMMSTMCQQYLLFIGRLCQTDFGVRLLNKNNVFHSLENIVRSTNHVCYVKLIVTGLNYAHVNAARRVLELALTESKINSGRLYATQFMVVLLRSKINQFEKWGIRMLVNQATSSKDKAVILVALEILEEACHEEFYLKEVIALWPKFCSGPCDDHGALLTTHFYSMVSGLDHKNANVQEIIDKWVQVFNHRYVLLVEADTHASMTQHTKNEDGSYCRRSFSSRPTVIPSTLLPHLFGQLARSQQGCAALQKYGNIGQLLEVIQPTIALDTESKVLNLKAALFAIGHTMSTTYGIEMMKVYENPESVAMKIIHHVMYSEIYSIRAIALTILGLIGSSNYGANLLYKLNWISVRHNRNTMWPVNELEDWLAKFLLLANSRHQHDELLATLPYNYNGLNELNSATGTSEEEFRRSNFSFNVDVHKPMDEANKESVPASQREFFGVNRMTKQQHFRSLSESKTMDTLNSWNQPQPPHQIGSEYNGTTNNGLIVSQRQRINSGTDSNTSGVSSCDSTFGKNIIMSDIQQTLSPIPSTSNLLEFRNLSAGQQGERYRKISLNSKFNIQDLQGIAKIRHIKRNQRPLLSESAAEEIRSIDFEKSSEQQILRSLKVRSLDRQQGSGLGSYSESLKLRESSELSIQSNESLTSMSSKLVPTATPPLLDLETTSADLLTSRLEDHEDQVRPCYLGICMPRNIMYLFPKRNLSTTYVSADMAPDIADGMRGAGGCLICCRTDDKRNFNDLSNHHRKLVLLKTLSSKFQVSSQDGPRQEFTETESVLVAILTNVQRMANPIMMRQAKMSLLSLKQRYSDVFQDLCLYSELMKSIGQNTYRQNARRFIHELFLDVSFDKIFFKYLNVGAKRGKNGGAAAASDSKDSAPDSSPLDESSATLEPELRIAEQTIDEVDSFRKDPDAAKGFTRVSTLTCNINKFPIKRDRSQSFNEQSSSRPVSLPPVSKSSSKHEISYTKTTASSLSASSAVAATATTGCPSSSQLPHSP